MCSKRALRITAMALLSLIVTFQLVLLASVPSPTKESRLGSVAVEPQTSRYDSKLAGRIPLWDQPSAPVYIRWPANDTVRAALSPLTSGTGMIKGYGQRKRKRVALGLFGGRFDSLRLTGPSWRRHILSAAHVEWDVFVCGHAQPGSEEMLREQFGGISNVTIRTTYFHKHSGRSIPTERVMMRCVHGMVERHIHRNPERFDWLVVSRVDIEWFAPLPPFEMLESVEANLGREGREGRMVWFPARNPWNGLPGSQALYSSKWIIKQPVGELKRLPEEVPEHFLLRKMLQRGVKQFGFFRCTHAVICIPTVCMEGDPCRQPLLCKDRRKLFKYEVCKPLSDLRRRRRRKVICGC